jgi:prepilin-type N-terminal cleavage/methylation domain-containing protein
MKLRASSRGYTAVELLMSIAVLAIGVSGIIAMQKIAVSTNRHSKNLALATQIARSWQDQLAADALLWNHPSQNNPVSDLAGDTEWLKFVGNGWFRPAFPTDATVRPFGPGFDALGNPVTDPNQLATAHFCTHLRLSWLRPEGQGNALIRTEVRVFWAREGQLLTDQAIAIGTSGICADIAPDVVAAALNQFHFVYMTSAVKQNPPS